MQEKGNYIFRVMNLTKSFGKLVAVNDLSFAINEGERAAIIGPNGAGKTTTFNLITGHLKPDKGIVEFYGKNITGLPPHKICRLGIGRTFQIVRYFPDFTVFEHVLVGAISRHGLRAPIDLLKRQVEDAIEKVGLSAKRNTLVRNLTIVDKKRVELATALTLKPKLLLLDELMAGLNPAEVDECVELLKRINEEDKITLIVVEHVMRAVMKLCNHIIVMHYGKKIAEGTPMEIATNKAVIEAYLGEGVPYA
jgi:branched-chain amino acid transport system ATP-binding protein